MCYSCGCLQPANDHGDARNLTGIDLQGAADWIGADIATVVGNIARTLVVCGAAKSIEPVASDLAECRVIKATDERRYTLGVAYPAMKADAARAADGHRDFVSAEALEKTAWEWMAKRREVNLFHRGNTTGHATVVESYIYRGPDWSQPSPVDGKPYVVKSGDWLLGAVWDEYGWSLVQSGLVNGWSPEGGARRVVPTTERLAQLRS